VTAPEPPAAARTRARAAAGLEVEENKGNMEGVEHEETGKEVKDGEHDFEKDDGTSPITRARAAAAVAIPAKAKAPSGGAKSKVQCGDKRGPALPPGELHAETLTSNDAGQGDAVHSGENLIGCRVRKMFETNHGQCAIFFGTVKQVGWSRSQKRRSRPRSRGRVETVEITYDDGDVECLEVDEVREIVVTDCDGAIAIAIPAAERDAS